MPAESPAINPDRKIDCTGLFCPIPVVKTREAMKGMVTGQVLEILSDDPGSDPDLKTWARMTGNEMVDITRDGAVYRFLIRKTR